MDETSDLKEQSAFLRNQLCSCANFLSGSGYWIPIKSFEECSVSAIGERSKEKVFVINTTSKDQESKFRVIKAKNEEERVFIQLVLSHSTSQLSFYKLLETLATIQANAEAFRGMLKYISNSYLVKMLACIISKYYPCDPQCRYHLGGAIQQRKVSIVETMLLRGVPYGKKESEMCRRAGLNDIADLMDQRGYQKK